MEDLFRSNGTAPTPEVMSNWEANLLSSDQNFSSLPTFCKLSFHGLRLLFHVNCSHLCIQVLRVRVESSITQCTCTWAWTWTWIILRPNQRSPQASLDHHVHCISFYVLLFFFFSEIWYDWDSNRHSLSLFLSFDSPMRDNHCWKTFTVIVIFQSNVQTNVCKQWGGNRKISTES